MALSDRLAKLAQRAKEAEDHAAAAQTKAKALRATMTVTVVDEAGHLVACHRMDEAQMTRRLVQAMRSDA